MAEWLISGLGMPDSVNADSFLQYLLSVRYESKVSWSPTACWRERSDDRGVFFFHLGSDASWDVDLSPFSVNVIGASKTIN